MEGDFCGGDWSSPGIVIGKAFLLEDAEFEIDNYHIEAEEVAGEIERLHKALNEVKEELVDIKEYMAEELGQEKARIFKAHIMFLNDPEVIPAIEKKIRKEKIRAEKAVDVVMNHYLELFDRMQNEYLRGRKSDVQDVKKRIIRELLENEIKDGEIKNRDEPGEQKNYEQVSEVEKSGETKEPVDCYQPEGGKQVSEDKIVVVARDLTPADTAKLDRSVVRAFVTAQGSRTSHSAIMARSLGVPAVVGLGEEILEKCNPGDRIIVDGIGGRVIVNPSLDLMAEYREKIQQYEDYQTLLTNYREERAETGDGKRIKVSGNIGEPVDVDSVLENGGEGIGLFRTEFLYMNREKLPSEEEQFRVYRSVAEKMGDRSVVIRTLDIGGGKNLPYFEMKKEENPFLGFRAIRISLEKKDIFKEQLRAILRAAVYGDIKIMYPMVSSLRELEEIKRIVSEAIGELKERGQEYNKDIEAGIMIEIPSTLMIADELAQKVDFFSIGTNDLIQYMLAVDRNNEKIASMHTPYHPAVLRFIKKIVDKGHENNIRVSMCGEAAGAELLLPYWVGIGIDELSMSAISILKTKYNLRRLDVEQSSRVVEKVLQLSTEKEIKNFLTAQKEVTSFASKRR